MSGSGRARFSGDRSRIQDGQCDDEPWATIDPEIADSLPNGRPEGTRFYPPTPKQRKRMVRNAAIKAAHDRGISQRKLAGVFGLPRSVIGDIVQGKQTCGRRRDRDPGDTDAG